MSINRANNTRLIDCKVYMQSFGHCVHFHAVDGVLIKGCLFTGTLRPTNDIYLENVTVREAGDFSYDLSSGDKGKVVMKNCRGDIAYNPLFNLTRGPVEDQGKNNTIIKIKPKMTIMMERYGRQQRNRYALSER